MKEILKERIYRKILKEYWVIGKGLRSRKNLKFRKVIRSLEKIEYLLIHKNSWSKNESKGGDKDAENQGIFGR